jgi:quercetin dioxygenase-like cupin family protein
MHAGKKSWHLTLSTLCLIAGSAYAQAPDDAALKWGPCPAFLPAGCQIAVLNGDPAKPNADLFFKVPAKAKLPAHWHTSAERLLLVSGELHVTYQGQETKVLKAGTYAYGLPKLPHSGVCVSAVPCVLFIAFEAPVDAVPVASTQ